MYSFVEWLNSAEIPLSDTRRQLLHMDIRKEKYRSLKNKIMLSILTAMRRKD